MKTICPHKNRDIAALCKTAAAIVDSQPTPAALVKPSSLATNSLELAASLFLQKIEPDYLAAYAGVPEQRLFMFRCVYVPIFCKTAIEFYADREGTPRYWLSEHGTCLLAFERMLLEMHLRKTVKLKRGVLNALAAPGLNYQYWTQRFDQWRSTAAASYWFFIKKQSPQIRKSARRQAAHLGTMQNLSGRALPAELFATMLASINSDVIAVAEFKKTAAKIKPARWGEPALDTWLIEIWPLVTEYGWNYSDIWRVANEKWDCPDVESFDTVARISDRCKKMLGLKLSPMGQAKQGRPKSGGESESPALPLLAGLAIWIRSIGDCQEEWIRGQF